MVIAVKRGIQDGWAWCDVCGKPEFMGKWYSLGVAFPCGQPKCNGKLSTKRPTETCDAPTS